jgi:diguanylate cyclase (GGDEF)-like protein
VLDARLEARTAELARSLTLANQELTQLALHDTLTGLPNRTLLADRIEQAMGRVAEQGGCFALMFIDLDGFKPVNDAFGHHIGDLLLKAVAARLRGHLHSQDTLARIGGDEFVLLVELRAGRCHGRGGQAGQPDGQPFRVAEHDLQLSASLGIVLYPGNGQDQHELLRNADAAMYHAKSAGKNGYSFFDVSMNSNARQQLQLLQDLRRRWSRPVPPALPAQVRRRRLPADRRRGVAALGAPAAWPAAAGPFHRPGRKDRPDHPHRRVGAGRGLPADAPVAGPGAQGWRMAVNLSAIQFCHAGLVESVAQALPRTACRPTA